MRDVFTDEPIGDTETEAEPEFNPAVLPFTVVIDSREQAPYQFRNIEPDLKDQRKGVNAVVVKTRAGALKTGDYSLNEFEDRIAIERKSRVDFLSCLTHDRYRFNDQLSRLQELEYAAVVVESSWSHLLTDGASNVSPKAIHHSVVAFQTEYYPNVHWWMCHDRVMAELTTLRLLERWWKVNGQ